MYKILQGLCTEFYSQKILSYDTRNLLQLYNS